MKKQLTPRDLHRIVIIFGVSIVIVAVALTAIVLVLNNSDVFTTFHL